MECLQESTTGITDIIVIDDVTVTTTASMTATAVTTAITATTTTVTASTKRKRKPTPATASSTPNLDTKMNGKSNVKAADLELEPLGSEVSLKVQCHAERMTAVVAELVALER